MKAAYDDLSFPTKVKSSLKVKSKKCHTLFEKTSSFLLRKNPSDTSAEARVAKVREGNRTH